MKLACIYKEGIYKFDKKSSSLEQQEAENYIFPIVEDMLNIKLDKNKKIIVNVKALLQKKSAVGPLLIFREWML